MISANGLALDYVNYDLQKYTSNLRLIQSSRVIGSSRSQGGLYSSLGELHIIAIFLIADKVALCFEGCDAG